ncbi:hypothetical protein ACFXPX_32820 [Kitasatospora sp. NPDC059146]|uniref:hypothetical protein n=1 Tax=unclassified Kitasatospora TaxID=2633591 RepID=UPI00367C2180
MTANCGPGHTDAITAFAHDHDLLVQPILGAYYDCGSPAGLHAANTVISGAA